MSKLFNVSSNPHIRSRVSTTSIMLTVILALMPTTCYGIYHFHLRAAWLVLISIATCVATEAAYELLMKKPLTIKDCSAIVTGLLLALNLPPTVPYWIPVIGGVFAILFVKMLFGGIGQNFMNPALGARCFLLLSFAGIMTNFKVDGVTTATPLAVLRNGESVNLMDMITGNTAGTIGETSAIAIMIGACIMILAGVIDLWVPAPYLISFTLFIGVFGAYGFDINYLFAELCGGGLMLGAFFMATDYATRPITKKGQCIYGILLGVLTGIFRVYGASAEGVSYAIIIGNLFVPLIEKFTKTTSFGKGAKKYE